jgi:hypothetical protein
LDVRKKGGEEKEKTKTKTQKTLILMGNSTDPVLSVLPNDY